MDNGRSYLVRFYVGAGTTAWATPEQVADDVRKTLLHNFGGATIFKGDGAWRNPQGEDAIEPSVIGEVALLNLDPLEYVDKRGLVRSVASYLADTLGQESVLTVWQPLTSVEFVKPPKPVLTVDVTVGEVLSVA